MSTYSKSFAQDYEQECATLTDEFSSMADLLDYTSNITDLTELEPKVLNVFYWQVRNPDGSYNNVQFNETILLENIAYLNIYFNQFKIYFKYRGYDGFNTPADLPLTDYVWDEDIEKYVCITLPGVDPDGYGKVDRCQVSSFFNYASTNYKMPNAMNVYVPHNTGFGGAARSVGSDMIILKPSKLTEVTATHEFGHALGLFHTRSKGNDCSNQEHNTRVEFLPNGDINLDFNARVADDELVDTAANTCYSLNVNGNITYPFIVDCAYVENIEEKDALGFPYTHITTFDVKNSMSDAYECLEDYLTLGQTHRMHHIISTNTRLIEATTTIASLYEPYKGEYYIAGPLDNGPSSIYYKPLFQPGFDYRFVECECEQESDCNEPTPWENGTDDFTYTNNAVLSIDKEVQSTAFNTITHPNHTAIKIIFDQYGVANGFSTPKRCYDNWNRAPIGGIITKFNDGVFNANVTITPQDSTSINNPQLINTLQPGLYNVEKVFEDGAVQQNVIVKENN